MKQYDPFARGNSPVGVRTIEALDRKRQRKFVCEIWYPASSDYKGKDLAADTQDVFTVPSQSTPRHQMAVRDAEVQLGTYPLITLSHASGQTRRTATFLCTHLASHGYVVAALDHSETFAPELARKADETPKQKAERIRGWIANRVPDVRFLLDHLLSGASISSGLELDATRVGLVGHSFGGWTMLAAAGEDPRVRAVAAFAPAGSSRPGPGIIPATLTFNWGRDVPTLYLVGENDTSLPLSGMNELFDRTSATKQMVILRGADHLHFIDNIEQEHETVREMKFPTELAWIQREMRPMTELCSENNAHLFVRSLTLSHFDAALKQHPAARQFLSGDIVAELAARDIDVRVRRALDR